MELFKLFGTIAINNSSANTEIDKTMSRADSLSTAFNNAGTKMSEMGKKLLPVSIAVGGIGISCINSAADVKAANSQFEQTFGEMQTQASGAMESVADSSGILQTRLQGVGTSIYAFAKTTGMDSADALLMMEDALQVTADSAAYYDQSLENTSESLKSFLKGNFENDAALGLSCTETTRNTAANELYGTSFKNLSESQKQLTLLQMVKDANELSGAMGQAARESDGWSNVTGNLKESLRLLGANVAEVILPAIVDLVQKATDFITKFTEMDDSTRNLIIRIAGIVAAAAPVLMILGNISSGIGNLLSLGVKLSSGMSGVGLSIGSLTGTGGKLITGIGSMVGKIGGALIPAIASVGAPVLAVIAVIGALVAAGVLIYKNWDDIKAFGEKAWASITGFTGAAGEKIKGFFSGVLDFVGNNWQGLLLLLVNPIAGGFKLIYDNCEGFRNFIDNFFGTLKESVYNMVENIKAKVDDLKEGVTSKVEELKEKAISKFAELKEKTIVKAEEIKEGAVNKFNELKDKAITKVEELKEKAVSKFVELKEKAVAKVEEMKEGTVNKFNDLKEKAAIKLQEMKEKSMNHINDLKEKGISGFASMASGALNKFDNLKDGIKEKLEWAKNIVQSAVEKFKSFFQFDWELPKIKLPHFNISGGFSLNPPSIPNIGVEWYKNGAIMTKPTAFGINPSTGKIMGGGEAGAEAIAPIDLLQSYIREAVADKNDRLVDIMNKMYTLLCQFLPELAEKQIILSTGETIGALATPMNEALGKIANKQGRIR